MLLKGRCILYGPAYKKHTSRSGPIVYARTILDADKMANSVDLFNLLQWIPFNGEASIQRCTLVFKLLNNKVPDEYI